MKQEQEFWSIPKLLRGGGAEKTIGVREVSCCMYLLFNLHIYKPTVDRLFFSSI